MKQVIRALSASILTIAVTGCDNNDPDFYRSSKGLATDKLYVYLETSVHTHYDEQGAPEDTHTTVIAEFSGFDKDGYYYSVALSEEDKISAGIDGELAELSAQHSPDHDEPLSVYYYRDFDAIAGGTTFDVVLDRDRDAALHSASVTLPQVSDFAITPSDETIDPAEPLVLSWSETEADTYRLKFLLACETNGEITYRSHLRLPNSTIKTIESPYSFELASFFQLENPTQFDVCELRTTLKTYSQAVAEDNPFAGLTIRSTREQSIINTLNPSSL